MAQPNTSPNREEPPLPDIHENPEPNWELFVTSWPPLRNYPREDERPPHWVFSPTTPDPKTTPVDPREAGLSGEAYIHYKSNHIQTIIDLMGNATSFDDGEIKRCAEWLLIIRRQLDAKLAGIPETEAEEREQLEELIAKVKSGLEKALWFFRKKF